MKENIVPHSYKIDQTVREQRQGHRGLMVLLTGLSGSGKSTIANALDQRLFMEGIRTYVLDGDNVRSGLNQNLGFCPEDRAENIRRIAELGRLFVDAGLVSLAAFVAPYERDRNLMRKLVGTERFLEVFVNTSLEVCEERDVKGLYAKARKGEIKNMTGISAPYEIPKNPDIEVTHLQTVKEATESIYRILAKKIRL